MRDESDVHTHWRALARARAHTHAHTYTHTHTVHSITTGASACSGVPCPSGFYSSTGEEGSAVVYARCSAESNRSNLKYFRDRCDAVVGRALLTVPGGIHLRCHRPDAARCHKLDAARKRRFAHRQKSGKALLMQP